MKGYKLLRGLLETSAIAFDENEVRLVDDTIQDTVEETESQLLQEAE